MRTCGSLARRWPYPRADPSPMHRVTSSFYLISENRILESTVMSRASPLYTYTIYYEYTTYLRYIRYDPPIFTK